MVSSSGILSFGPLKPFLTMIGVDRFVCQRSVQTAVVATSVARLARRRLKSSLRPYAPRLAGVLGRIVPVVRLGLEELLVAGGVVQRHLGLRALEAVLDDDRCRPVRLSTISSNCRSGDFSRSSRTLTTQVVTTALCSLPSWCAWQDRPSSTSRPGRAARRRWCRPAAWAPSAP